MIMAVASPQVELLISLFFSEDDVDFSYVSYISTSGITTLHTQDIFLEKLKNHANNLIGDLIRIVPHTGIPLVCGYVDCSQWCCPPLWLRPQSSWSSKTVYIFSLTPSRRSSHDAQLT